MQALWAWFLARSVLVKIVLILVVLGLAILLSPLSAVIAALVLIVSLFALIIRLLRRRPLRTWAVTAGVCLALVLFFSGIAGTLYGGGTEQASSPEPTQEARPTPPERTEERERARTVPETVERLPREPDEVAEISLEDDRESVTVTRVIDGDTLEIYPAIDGITDVRLIGIDAPEMSGECGEESYAEEARTYLTDTIEGSEVDLEFDEERTDRYDRLLAYVHDPRASPGIMVNEDLLSAGYAQVYTVEPNTEHADLFLAAQEEAMSLGLGIWGLPLEEQGELADRGNGIGGGVCVEEAPQEPVPSSDDLDCADFDTQEEAQEVLDEEPSDPNLLDEDEDGEACESLSGESQYDLTEESQYEESQYVEPQYEESQYLEPTPDVSSLTGGVGEDVDCEDFSTSAEAQEYLLPDDPYGLDADGDGQACDSLP